MKDIAPRLTTRELLVGVLGARNSIKRKEVGKLMEN